MTILKKNITPNVELVVNGGSSGVSFALRVVGTDALRPAAQTVVQTDAASALAILQGGPWEAVLPEPKA